MYVRLLMLNAQKSLTSACYYAEIANIISLPNELFGVSFFSAAPPECINFNFGSPSAFPLLDWVKLKGDTEKWKRCLSEKMLILSYLTPHHSFSLYLLCYVHRLFLLIPPCALLDPTPKGIMMEDSSNE